MICKIETTDGRRYFTHEYMYYHNIVILNGRPKLLRVMGEAYTQYSENDLSELFGYPTMCIRSFIALE